MALILIASNDWLSAPETEGWLRKLLAAVFGPISVAKLKMVHFALRKAGHFVSYAILGWLSYRSARSRAASGSVPDVQWSLRAALVGLTFSLATASLDEIHQVFTEARSGSFADVLLDMSGAASALALLWIASRWKRRTVGRPQV